MVDVVMPRLSDTMEEGTVSRWLKAEGDQVRRGDVLAEVETDKATMELEAYDEGVLQRLLVPEGATVPIGEPVAVIGEAAAAPAAAKEAAAPPAAEEPAAAAPPAAEEPVAAAPPAAKEPAAPPAAEEPAAPPPPVERPPAAEPAAPPAAPPPAGRMPTSPLARKIARERGVDLATVTGTGPDGRIVRADVEAAAERKAADQKAAEEKAAVEKAAKEKVRAPAPPPAPPVARPAAAPAAAGPAVAAPVEDEEVPLSAVRRITAQRLTESATTTPHFHLTSVVDAGALLAFRHQVNEQLAATGTRVTVTDLLIRACAVTLRAHPQVNSSWAGDRILRHGRVHVGVAVALDDGLIVPVVRDADRKSLGEISLEARDLAARARSGKLNPDEFRGGTFTISNLGMYGIDQFTAVINPPEAAILAVGAATERPTLAQGELTTATTMALTLGIDHRVLDGATAARFLGDLKEILETPLRIVT